MGGRGHRAGGGAGMGGAGAQGGRGRGDGGRPTDRPGLEGEARGGGYLYTPPFGG